MVEAFDPLYVRSGADRPLSAAFYLQAAFSWCHTTEGGSYWFTVHNGLIRGRPLTDEVRAKLVAMLLTETGGGDR